MAKLIDNDELIRLYAEPGRGYTDEEMGKRFGVGRDAIFKRRKKLKKEYGDDFFIETERGRFRIDSRTFISNIKVSWEEALILYLATRRLSRNTRLPSRPVQNALSKLATALYKPMTERLVKAATTVPEHPEEKRRAEILTTLIRGWSEQYKVHIRYLGLKSDKPAKHTISPYLIEPSPWSDSVYVIAKTNVWDGLIPFHLERIQKATFSTEPFTIDEDFTE
jgi:predicted DNA-binding transcriptional regulator YafY